MIVASVLLALAADAWWQDRQNRWEEQVLLEGLRAEFLGNVEELDQRIDQHERLGRAAGHLAGLLRLTDEADLTVPDTLLYGLMVMTTYDATLGTLEEARSSGRTSLIQDGRLRALLGAWPGRLRDAQEEVETARRLSESQLDRLLLDSVDMSLSIGNVSAGDSPIPRWLRGERPYEHDTPLRRIPATIALTNYAAQRARALRRSSQELSGLRSQLDSIVILIDGALDR